MPKYSTDEELETFYEEVMKAESIGMGTILDRNMHNKHIPFVFRKKFGMSFHSAAVLLYAGKLPGHERKLAIEIAEMVNELKHVNVCAEYFSTSVATAVRLRYDLSHWPKFKISRRPEDKRKMTNRSKAPKKSQQQIFEKCLECGKQFLEREDGMHCFCTSCAPNGVSYGNMKNNSSDMRSGMVQIYT